jgi:hypothetical protein
MRGFSVGNLEAGFILLVEAVSLGVRIEREGGRGKKRTSRDWRAMLAWTEFSKSAKQ